jgi:hypothetical protein
VRPRGARTGMRAGGGAWQRRHRQSAAAMHAGLAAAAWRRGRPTALATGNRAARSGGRQPSSGAANCGQRELFTHQDGHQASESHGLISSICGQQPWPCRAGATVCMICRCCKAKEDRSEGVVTSRASQVSGRMEERVKAHPTGLSNVRRTISSHEEHGLSDRVPS